LVDAVGTLTGFRLLPGQAHALRGTGALIDGLACGQCLANRALNAEWLREGLTGAGIEPVIPPKSNRRFPAEFDRINLQVAPPDREPLRQAQGIQRHRHALLQD
jgi:hypothetical protein